MNENGLITVTIRGSDDDVQKAKKTIEEITADLLIVATQPEPIAEKKYEIIDWKAAAQQCVSDSPHFPMSLIENVQKTILFLIGRSCKGKMVEMSEINQKFLQRAFRCS